MKNLNKGASIALAMSLLVTGISVNNQETKASLNTYTVKAGDTLWSIANKNKITVEELKEWNNIKTNTISTEQKLIIEKPVQKTTYTVKAGDTLYKVATTYKVTVEEVKKWNSLKTDTLAVGQKLTIETKTTNNNADNKDNTNTNTNNTTIHTTTYTVKAGDTLYGVATTYKVTVEEIKKWNSLKTETLTVGQKLKIETKQKEVVQEKETKEKTGVVTADVLNVRKEPTTTATAISKLYTNAKVTILEEKNNWYKVNTTNGAGWISADYVKITNENSTTPKETETKVEAYQVTATVLNMRSTNSTTGSLVTTIPYNAKINVTEIKGNWAYAIYGNHKGWVSTDYIKKAKSVTNKSKTIMLDAGHGGGDPGAVSKIDGTYEKTLVLATSLKLKTALENEGYTVKMVRTNDSSCKQLHATLGKNELDCRVQLTNQENPDIFISIHANSVDGAGKGTETYYSLNSKRVSESERLASVVHTNYQPSMTSTNRGVKKANYYVITHPNVPSILLELGFMSDSSDLSKMKNATIQQNIANGIVNGVNDYFGY